MPKTRTQIDYPALDDFEPYREPAERIARFEDQERLLQADELRLAAEVDRLANQRREGEPELDLDALDAVLAGDVPPSSPLQATRLDLENVRRKLVVVRRAIEQGRIELDRVRNQASTELLTGLVPDYVELSRDVVFAICKLADANDCVWGVGDELTRRGFRWEHVLPPGKAFERGFINLNTSTSAASKFLVEKVRDGLVAVEEIEKSVRSPVLMDQLRAAEKEHKRLEKTA